MGEVGGRVQGLDYRKDLLLGHRHDRRPGDIVEIGEPGARHTLPVVICSGVTCRLSCAVHR
jgi:hypothetical protein